MDQERRQIDFTNKTRNNIIEIYRFSMGPQDSNRLVKYDLFYLDQDSSYLVVSFNYRQPNSHSTFVPYDLNNI